jgi:hypothetical protein
MQIYFSTIRECLNYNTIHSVFKSNFGISDSEADTILSKLRAFLEDIRTEISLIIETDYVDKVYRDSYYCYYSTKLKLAPRECIKISLFDCENIQFKHFNATELNQIIESYLGFIVIRPTWNNPIGRNIISPKALKNNNIKICSADVQSSTLGLKLKATGFPHSSQDAETMTCAETTIWSLMEYFGNKYPEYQPILPSKIIKTLEGRTFDRQIPSHGLFYQDISYVLTKQGFGTMVYSGEFYNKNEFQKIFSCYIESGIPMIVTVSNDKKDINHALLCVGRDDLMGAHFDSLAATNIDKTTVYEWNKNIENFVFVDDNMPPYQKAKFSYPSAYYHLPEWDSCKITHFIVPLYHKIYLEASEAMDIANNIALNFIEIKEQSVLKTFLASSRSYRNYIVNSSDIDWTLKDFLLHKNLPKCVWVTEISTIEDMKNNKITGVILIDATEKSQTNLASFIFACYEKEVCLVKENNLQKIPLNIQFYNHAFDKNLIAHK